MNNGYNIEWSDQATLDFEEIVQFLFNIWGETIVRKFVRSVDNELIRISTFPYAFPASSLKTGIRRCVLSKFNTIYYQVKDQTIYIVTIHDNRSNPELLKKKL
ncbi:type II toxin-antitoxin system RelE/ParE family toxin [Parabacteroides chinchillae]|uniref:Plasmid stabilization system protein ParE n=1 Tax=Parabacteroides chinchillae TaxID=871327 RepID=A0A8G2F3P3_9BACT|nr:type II toxin-antitoxin system RelE/ParE family toxin [Parabacteroides chinchillae]SEG17960.1 Plasmid stabilization system protein ParE [Parabacteroides chinchillae]